LDDNVSLQVDDVPVLDLFVRWEGWKAPQNDEESALDDDESAKVDGVPVLNLFIPHNES